MWRALLIDDETPARSHLRELLSVHPEVVIVGEAANVPEAVEACAALTPNLLFLDLQMPKGSGFELLARIPHSPEIIFVTAYEQYAVRAFEVNAIDYLLKPVFADRLALALRRLDLRRSEDDTPPPAVHPDESVFLRTSKGLRVVLVPHITHIQADGNYTTVWLADGQSFLIDRTMATWQSMLARTSFVRIDRSLLINLAHLEEARLHSRDAAQLRFRGRPDVIKIGRAARSRLQAALPRG